MREAGRSSFGKVSIDPLPVKLAEQRLIPASRPGSCEGMRRLHGPLQPIAGDMGVDLGCGDVGMAEHGLHAPQIGTAFHEMCGESVAQHVGRKALRIDTRFDREILKHLMTPATRQVPFPPPRRKKKPRRRWNERDIAREKRFTNREIGPERFVRSAAKRCKTLSPALPAHMHEALVRTD